jgi:hypothetical protein
VEFQLSDSWPPDSIHHVSENTEIEEWLPYGTPLQPSGTIHHAIAKAMHQEAAPRHFVIGYRSHDLFTAKPGNVRRVPD